MAKRVVRESWRAFAIAALAAITAVSPPAQANPPAATFRTVDLTKVPIKGLPPSLDVTLYRDAAASGKRPLVVFVPQFGANIDEGAYRHQAQYFADAGYVVAVPHLTGLYNDGTRLPVYDARLDADFVEDTTPFAVEVLAAVAALSSADGEARAAHVVLGVGLGGLIAARYAALHAPGCRGLVMISAGFGAKRTGMSSNDDMRASEQAFRRLGPQVAVPSVWIYATGNKRIPDATASDLFAAFSSGGAPAQLVVLPSIGMDGDALFTKESAPVAWEAPVAKFLNGLDFN